MGIPAIATGIFGELANKDIAAARGVLMPSVFTGEPKATGPYEDELHRGVLPAFELVTEPLLLIAVPLGVLAGVMNGEKPPPACLSKPRFEAKQQVLLVTAAPGRLYCKNHVVLQHSAEQMLTTHLAQCWG